ncbi:unnamed protein product [Rangifer tarandus platyrhynchus]|uniref:Uncharacterized protein n=2 Tax=Rangifer tarandus platyrhynchus TaxID=3082113 RepID=A0ACB0ELB3_RANTA|nr:unnamed protein product [Rangifer tarandus platyrhynchus]CAI9701366.1 unnamed protein product [Rangifer tarandus platyrhynchus]
MPAPPPAFEVGPTPARLEPGCEQHALGVPAGDHHAESTRIPGIRGKAAEWGGDASLGEPRPFVRPV